MGYLAEKHWQRVLFARAQFVGVSRREWKEQSLIPFCYHMMKQWNIKDLWGKNVKSKRQCGRFNVIGDEEDEPWSDKSNPGLYNAVADRVMDGNDEQENDDPMSVSNENKIKDVGLVGLF